MTLQEQLKALKGRLNAENDLGGQKDTAKIAELEQQIADLNIQILAENQQVEAEVRAQEQEEKVESIQLPYDFSEIFADPRANDIIIELIKDFQRQAYEEHNAELSAKEAAHLEELRVASDRELQLKRDNDDLQVKYDKVLLQSHADITELNQKISQLASENVQALLERDDAFAKRDAAVYDKEGIETLLTEKQAHIDTLRNEIAIGAKSAVNVVNIDPTDRLVALVQESKNAKVKSALDIALERTEPFRGKVIPEGQVVAQLNAPEAATFQILDQTGNPISGVDTTESVSVPTEDQVAFREEGEVHPEPSTVDQGNSGVEVAGKTLEERVTEMENHIARLNKKVFPPLPEGLAYNV